MKNIEKKKTLKEKIFKPMDKKYKDLFSKIFIISFVILSVIFSYALHWVPGLIITFSAVMSLYFLLCPYKVFEVGKLEKASKSDNAGIAAEPGKPEKAAKPDIAHKSAKPGKPFRR